MGLLDKITEDIKSAMKSKDRLKTDTLRFLVADIKNKVLETRKELSDDEILGIISSQIKKRKESIEAFNKGSRLELAEKTQKEIDIISAYLPEQLSRDEIEKLAVQAVAETHGCSSKDMGKVMAKLMPSVKGKADNRVVSEIVKTLLDKEKPK